MLSLEERFSNKYVASVDDVTAACSRNFYYYSVGTKLDFILKFLTEV